MNESQPTPFGQPLKLLPGPQLLLDDVLVEDRVKLTRVLQHPAKYAGNPVLVRDVPWEDDYQQIWHVMRDDQIGRFRMWYGLVSMKRYEAVRGAKAYQALAYAESDDGYRWTKPTFDFCPFAGHAKTNVLQWGTTTPILNPDTSDPARRFLAVGLRFREHASGINRDGIDLLYSADGLRWEREGDEHLLDLHSDTKNHLVYDAQRRRWLLYCRPVAINASGRGSHRDFRRRVSVMVSRDLRDWTYPQTVFYPDEHDTSPDIDHCQVFRYGSHLLMLYAAMDSPTTGRMHLRLASSGDGIHWTPFPTREDFILHGPQGTYDAGIIGAASPPVRVGDRLLIYYNALSLGQYERITAPGPWTGAGAVAELPVDRFVAQRAGDEPGWLLTRPFLLEGNTLRVNMAAGTQGSVQVEVVKQPPRTGHADYYVAEHPRKGYTHAFDGFGLDDCEPLTGDSVNQEVRWRGKNVAALVGQPIHLRFRVQNADLFSFSISNSSVA